MCFQPLRFRVPFSFLHRFTDHSPLSTQWKAKGVQGRPGQIWKNMQKPVLKLRWWWWWWGRGDHHRGSQVTQVTSNTGHRSHRTEHRSHTVTPSHRSQVTGHRVTDRSYVQVHDRVHILYINTHARARARTRRQAGTRQRTDTEKISMVGVEPARAQAGRGEGGPRAEMRGEGGRAGCSRQGVEVRGGTRTMGRR